MQATRYNCQTALIQSRAGSLSQDCQRLNLQELLRVMAGNLAVVEQAQGRLIGAAQFGRIRAALMEGAT